MIFRLLQVISASDNNEEILKKAREIEIKELDPTLTEYENQRKKFVSVGEII